MDPDTPSVLANELADGVALRGLWAMVCGAADVNTLFLKVIVLVV